MWILGKKCKKVREKKQIIYQKPVDCLKHLIINRSPSKMCAKDQETQVLKQNSCMANWQSKRGHCGWEGRMAFLMVQLASWAKQENSQSKEFRCKKHQAN